MPGRGGGAVTVLVMKTFQEQVKRATRNSSFGPCLVTKQQQYFQEQVKGEQFLWLPIAEEFQPARWKAGWEQQPPTRVCDSRLVTSGR